MGVLGLLGYTRLWVAAVRSGGEGLYLVGGRIGLWEGLKKTKDFVLGLGRNQAGTVPRMGDRDYTRIIGTGNCI